MAENRLGRVDDAARGSRGCDGRGRGIVGASKTVSKQKRRQCQSSAAAVIARRIKLEWLASGIANVADQHGFSSAWAGDIAHHIVKCHFAMRKMNWRRRGQGAAVEVVMSRQLSRRQPAFGVNRPMPARRAPYLESAPRETQRPAIIVWLGGACPPAMVCWCRGNQLDAITYARRHAGDAGWQ